MNRVLNEDVDKSQRGIRMLNKMLQIRSKYKQKRHNDALKEGLELMVHADSIWNIIWRDRLYIKTVIKQDKYFKMPMRFGGIVLYTNSKYGVEKYEQLLSRTSLNRYHRIGIDKRKSVGMLLLIPMVLLNVMRLRIKVLQPLKRSQASGQIIKGKLVASVSGIEHKGFDPDWVCSWVHESCPDEIVPTSVSQQMSIRNEWNTQTKVNDWYICNKKTLIEIGLAIDRLDLLPDGTYAAVTIEEIENQRIVNFDETDHPFFIVIDKVGSRSIRWGHPDLPRGMHSFISYIV